MPIPYEALSYNDILHHQAAYECFDKAGKSLFSEWDIIGFEKAVLGAGDTCYLAMADKIKSTANLFGNLNKDMPFLRFREEGQHYGYELLLSPPPSWSSRGAPLWWAYAARCFTYDKLPMDEKSFFEKYKSIAKEFGLSINGSSHEYIERFAAGGMSSGIVTEDFVRQGWYTVRHRNRLYQKDGDIKDYYLDKAIERINLYCKKYDKGLCEVTPNLDNVLFNFAMEDSKATDKQKEIAMELWGLKTGKPLSVREVAEKYGVSKERIYQVERRAIQHLIRGNNNPLLKY